MAEQIPDEKTAIVALLHDVIEDTSYSLQDLRELDFDEDVLAALKLMTPNKKYRTWNRKPGVTVWRPTLPERMQVVNMANMILNKGGLS